MTQNTPEAKHIVQSLYDYTYADFQKDLSTWLLSGRTVFSITGNLTADSAVEIAEGARSILQLKPVQVDDLASTFTMKLPAGKTLSYETDLVDDKNENSSSMIIYQGQ
jgi:hypothetical protein